MNEIDNGETVNKQIEVMMSNIDSLIMMCDNPYQLLMLASSMLSSTKHIYETTLGPENAKIIMTEVAEGKHDAKE